MKTDKDLNATNQLIKVIRGEAYSIPQERPSQKEGPVEIQRVHPGWWIGGKVFSLILIVACMIIFTFLSVSYLSRDIKDLESRQEKLAGFHRQIMVPSEISILSKKNEELAASIDAISSVFSAQRPYVSSLIKEISHIFPKNCFLNRLQIYIPPEELSEHQTALTIEGTLAENALLGGVDLSHVLRSIEASPLFAQTRVGYQDKSILFNYRTVDFQIDFSLE